MLTLVLSVSAHLALAFGPLPPAAQRDRPQVPTSPSAPSSSGGPFDKADFVFVVDHSASMGNEIAGVASGLTRFTQGLQAKGIDARFAVVLFGGPPEVRQDFTSDADLLAEVFANIEILSISAGKFEAGLEAIRMSLGAAVHNFAAGLLAFRPDAIKNIVLVTDENSDGPRFIENRAPEQTGDNPPGCNDFAPENPWQLEVDLTARAAIESNAFVNLLIKTGGTLCRAVECQYGDYLADHSLSDLSGFDPAATLANLELFGLDACLQAQVLRAGLISRSFDVRQVGSMTFVDNFFDAKIDEVENPCRSSASWAITGSGTPGPSGLPSLALSDLPRQGLRVEVVVGNPSSVAVPCCLLIGDPIDPASTLYGVNLLVNPTISTRSLLVPPGGMRVTWDVETGVDTCGRTYHLQAVMRQGSGLAASDRLTAVVGD